METFTLHLFTHVHYSVDLGLKDTFINMLVGWCPHFKGALGEGFYCTPDMRSQNFFWLGWS